MPKTNNNKKRKTNGKSGDDDVVVLDEEDRDKKSLRSNTADLKVIVGNTDKVIVAGKEEKKKRRQDKQKVFWHVSQVLASQSNYVDTLLSNPLAVAASTAPPTRSKKKHKSSSNTDNEEDDVDASDYKVITFPDITPGLWEKMIQGITSPSSIRSMSTNDAKELIVPYDKYDFSTGIELCDEVFSSFIESSLSKRYRLEEIVKTILIAYEKNLDKTINIGMYWFSNLLVRHEKMILTVSHIQQLSPVIDRFIKDEGSELQYGFQYGSGADRVELKYRIESAMTYTNEGYDLTTEEDIGEDSIDILNPLFPRLLISHLRLNAAQQFTMEIVDEIIIKGCSVCNGSFTSEKGCNHDIRDDRFSLHSGEDTYLHLMRNKIGDWSIVEWNSDDETYIRTMFVSNFSRYKTLPPRGGWEKVHAGQRNSNIYGTPKLTYFNTTEDEDGDTIRKQIQIVD